jgi:hypothetical protein
MRITLLCTAVLATPHGGIPAVNRQILRQFDRISEERGISLFVDAWSLHDEALSPEEAARAAGLRPAG